MAERIILVSGPVASGKSSLARGLAERFDVTIFKTRALIEKRLASRRGRQALQAEGDRLDRTTRGRWVRDELIRELQGASLGAFVLVDSVRIVDQVEAIREAFGSIVTHIHLTAPLEVLARRYGEVHGARPGETLSYEEVRENPTERSIESLGNAADIVIDTNRCTNEDVLVRAATRLRLYRRVGGGFVDVVIGGQYGSEGKGQIASHLARGYDLLVRVGGPNAGHQVFEHPKPFTHRLLPSGTRRSTARLLIGPGAVLNVEILMREISDCGVEVGRLSIDPNAMIISEEDILGETELIQSIGSTGQGVGIATARRITDRGKSVVLADGIPELRPYIRPALDVLDDAISAGEAILLEGTQGTGLSLYHGSYPHVTSRDTTVAGCLAEAGIAHDRVRKIILVCRTFPIRVADPTDGTSGPLAQRISWEVVARRSGQSVHKLRAAERGSVSKKLRRVGEFEWALLRKAVLLNAPTDIAVTFTDYLSKQNERAMRFEQLQPDTINFIEEVERVAGAKVSLIATGFGHRSIIDRRSW